MHIGFDQFTYAHERNIYGSPVPATTFERAQRLPLERFWPGARDRATLEHSYVPIPFVRQRPDERSRHLRLHPRFDLYHTWNRIYRGPRPWIVSFESVLPRFNAGGKAFGRALDALASDHCRAILPISEMAARTFLAAHPELAEVAGAKLRVLPPMQPVLATPDAVRQKLESPPTLPLRAVLVGNEFFVKGGAGVLVAMERMLRQGLPVHLTVISALTGDSYVTGAARQEMEDARTRLRSLTNVTWVDQLPNPAVLEALAAADVMLLPSLNDSFGYTTLEAMAHATPVVATNVRALPEIIDETVGWVIPLRKGTERPDHWIGMEQPMDSHERATAFAEATETIAANLVAVFERLLDHPEEARHQAAAAYARAQERYTPERHAQQLGEIYRSALKR